MWIAVTRLIPCVSWEIEPDRWIPFLAEFTRENRGAHARLEVLAVDQGYQVETENRPFDGVSADAKDVSTTSG
jgi:hypothetical protein